MSQQSVFHLFYARASERKGAAGDSEALLSGCLSDDAGNSPVSDAELLSAMSRQVFSKWFVWRVVVNKMA